MGEDVFIQLAPFDLTMYSAEEQQALAGRFASFFASLGSSCRMYAVTRPFSLEPVNRRITQLMQLTRESWRRQAMGTYGRFVERVTADSHLKSADFYLQVFDSRLPASVLAGAASSAFGTRTWAITHLPPLVLGSYRETPRALQPDDPRLPWLSFLHSYDMRGSLSPALVFNLLRLPFPLALAVDVLTVPTQNVPEKLQMAYQVLQSQLLLGKPGDRIEMGLEQANRDVQGVMRAVEREGTGLHQVTLGVAVMADLENQLQERVKQVQQTALTHQVWMRPAVPIQREIKELFDGATTPSRVRSRFARNMTSHGLGVLVPYGYSVRDDTDGILQGIDMDGGYPIFCDRFRLASYNKLVLGKTGSAKTWTEFMLAYRDVVVNGHKVVIIDPQRNAEYITHACGGSYNRLDLKGGTAINVLDFVEESLSGQISHVIVLLELLLKRPLSNEEKTAVDRALMTLYDKRNISIATPLAAMPRLEDLRTTLGDIEWESTHLQRDLERYISGSLAPIFNAVTTIDVHLRAPIVAFDLKEVEGEHRELLVFALLSIIAREIQRKGQGTHGTIIVDEFGVLSAIPELALAVERAFKRYRVFGWGVTAIDQNWSMLKRFTGIVENAELKMLMRMDREPAYQIAQDLGLTAHHRQHLMSADKGEGLLMIGNKVHRFRARLSPAEWDLLERSTIKARESQ